MLKNTDHCRLCQNHKADIKHGLICTLTNQPPTFSRTCSKIEFGKVTIDQIKNIDLRNKKLNESKFDVYGGIVFWPIIGLLVLLGDYLLYKYLLSYGVISTLVIFIFCIGVILIAMGTGPFLEFKKEKKVVESKKDNLDAVLSLYGKKYNVTYYPKRNFLDTRIMVKEVKIEGK